MAVEFPVENKENRQIQPRLAVVPVGTKCLVLEIGDNTSILRGSEIVEQYTHTSSEDNIRNAAQGVWDVINELPRVNRLLFDQKDFWSRNKKEHEREYGEDSIYKLLPDDFGNIDIKRVISTTRALTRHGVNTQLDLLEINPEAEINISGIGPKSTPIVKSLRELALQIYLRKLTAGEEQSDDTTEEAETETGNLQIETTSAEERYKSAKDSLNEYIKGLSPAVNPESKSRRHYRIDRILDQRQYAEESLYGMFPQNTDRNVSFIVRTINTLHRAGINTKSDLSSLTQEELLAFGNVGDKTLQLTGLMKDVIAAERGFSEKKAEEIPSEKGVVYSAANRAEYLEKPGYLQAKAVVDQIRGQILDSLTESRESESGARWQIFYKTRVHHVGEDSLVTLLPEEIEKETRILTIAINKLHRSGIRTKEELMIADLTENSRFRGIFGEKTKALALNLQELAIAEQYMQWNA